MIEIKNDFDEDKIDIYRDGDGTMYYTGKPDLEFPDLRGQAPAAPKFIGTCESVFSFNDLRLQIKRANAKGYHFYYNGNRYEIESNGRISPEYPFELYTIICDQLAGLVE
jgi:hypothetical protein